MKIRGETRVLITGANGGIGQAIARAFHKAGAKLMLSGLREDALRPVAEELGAQVIIAPARRTHSR